MVQREYSNKLQRAVGFFAQSTLAAAWNGWWAALAHKRENQDKLPVLPGCCRGTWRAAGRVGGELWPGAT